MKRKIINSIIFGVITVLLTCTIFFSHDIEIFLKLKPDMGNINDGAFEVHFIDVGQGDAIAIRFPNDKTMLVDSGPEFGEDNLREYLDNIFFTDNYDTFDYIFLTHSDIDHSGNMEFILDNYKVNNFYRPNIFSSKLEGAEHGFKVDNECYDSIINKLESYDITTFFTTDNSVIDVGGSVVEVYLPTDLNKIDEPNDFSPFLIISSKGTKVCLSGDAGSEYEEEIVKRGVLSEVDLFKLAHHGSKYSNCEAYINVLSPKYVACSVGENSYGHPTSEVLLRLANFDIDTDSNTFSTFKTTLNDGNLIYYVNSNEMEFMNIEKLNDYLFVDWYVIVVIIDLALLGKYLLIVIPKKKIHINKHMKNMKQ